MRVDLSRIATLAALLLANSASAQSLRGVVRESQSLMAIPGAVVMTLDSTGAVLARSLTNERGQFRLPDNVSVQRLRTMRIGYHAIEQPIDRLKADLASLQVNMVRVPTLLDVVQVSGRSLCPARNDGAAALGLWQQVRTGLLATVVAQEANPAVQLRLTFEKIFSVDSDTVQSMKVSADSNVTGPASFQAARSPALLVEQGFVVDSAGRRRYFGPDAEVLMDDAFMQAYCFRLATPSATRIGQMGLTFFAPKQVRGRIDIRGTLWVDTVRRVVSDVEFRYAGLDSAQERLRPGGAVSFREMRKGTVMVDRWHLRFVSVESDTVVAKDGNRTITTRRFAKEVGGELAQATWPDQTWQASMGRLQARAVTASGAPAVGAVLMLRDTHYRAVSDANGAFVFDRLVPGPYVVSVADSVQQTGRIDLPAKFAFRAERDSTRTAVITIPTLAEQARPRATIAERSESIPVVETAPNVRKVPHTNLARDSSTASTAVLAGIAKNDSTKTALPDVEVSFPELGLSVRTNARGEFHVIGIPPGTHRMIARSLGFSPIETFLTFASSQIDERTLFLHRVTVLESVRTTASAHLRSFDENRRVGLGKFLTREDLQKVEGHSIASVLGQLSGVQVVRGSSASAWLASGRGPRSLSGASVTLPDAASYQRGARAACYAQVWVDGVHVYKARDGEPLFDLSSIMSREIEAVEYYTGPAETPAIYANLKSTCGVLVVWTHR